MVKELTLLSVEHANKDRSRIVLFNDDVNSFDWVIKSLVDVCDHSSTQAEQCAWIVHFNGKYAVQSGDMDEMRTRCGALNERGLTAEIV